MKRLPLLLTLFLSAFSLALHAEHLSREAAHQIASRFFQKTYPTRQTALKTQFSPVFLWDSRALTESAENAVSSRALSDETPTFYVFAPASGEGFVILSADDTTRPVLGYSLDRPAPTADALPENMAAYLQGLNDEIAHIRTMKPEFLAENGRSLTSRADETIGNPVVQLQTAEWAQRKPFNLHCPQDNGSYCATGCIPTAFSIILRYHQWPDRGEGILPAYLSGNRAYPIDECDLSQHVYDWEQMLPTYNDVKYTDAQADAVALLMADVGHCFEVTYGVNSTGGYHTGNSFRKFLQHFKYSDTGERLDRDILNNDTEWIRRVKADLDASRPIAYSATSAINANKPDGRHIFVCDGYTDRDYFHFNWGWGGNGNGYFALSAMNPNENYNFIVHHVAYFNIVPLKPAATYTVNVSATEGGTARVDGRPTTTVKEGTTVKLTARAQYDYRFTHWSVNGVKVSEAATYEPVITKNTDFLAHFTLKETGIGETEVSAMQLSVPAAGMLHITHCTGLVQLYSLQGQLLETLTVNGAADVQLQSGIYLVKSGNQQKKICIP